MIRRQFFTIRLMIYYCKEIILIYQCINALNQNWFVVKPVT